MQRITGGQLRGRKLSRLPGGVAGLRPTGARVREAIFNRLQGEVEDARVLDLFAGSGALSIEALSRGARVATLIERDRAVLRHLQRQLASFGIEDRARVIGRDALAHVRAGPSDGPVDIVFLDPPFAMALETIHEIIVALAAKRWLAPDGVVVYEYERAGGRPGVTSWGIPEGLTLEVHKRYGQIGVDYLRWAAPEG